MSRSRSSFLIIVQVILIIASVAGLIWANYQFVSSFPAVNKFAVEWAIVRTYFNQGISPYDAQVPMIAAQSLGLNPDTPGLVFSYPFYTTILILPFAVITDLAIAKTIWLFVLELCLFGVAIAGLRFTQWRPGLWNWLLFLIYCVFGFPASLALVEGDMIILVVILIAATFMALRLGWDEIGGIALAFSTIIPEAIIIVSIFILLWVISNRRLRFLVWFLFTIIVMTIVGLFFIPDWPLQYLRLLINSDYAALSWFTTFSIFATRWPAVGKQLAWFISIGMIILQLVEWALAVRKDFNWFIWTACLTITAGFWTGLPIRLENFYLLTIPMILILAIWDQRIPGKIHWLPMVGLISAISGIWLLFFNKLFTSAIHYLPDTLIITIPLLIIFGLYWIRWWCVRPQRLGMDELRAYEEFR